MGKITPKKKSPMRGFFGGQGRLKAHTMLVVSRLGTWLNVYRGDGRSVVQDLLDHWERNDSDVQLGENLRFFHD